MKGKIQLLAEQLKYMCGMERKRLYSIDSLKGIACVVIAFLWHYLNMQSKAEGMPMQNLFGIFYDYGQYFVELFFMISGFVMAYCYKMKIMDGINFLEYIFKRYKHLYPTFFTTLMYITFFQVFYNAISGDYYIYKVSVWHFVLNILCIQNGWLTTDQSFNGPAWCVSVEIFLYILFYITTKLAKKDNNVYILINGFVFIIGIVCVWLNKFDYPFVNMFMMRGVSCFYAGILICELNDYIEKKEKIANNILLAFIIFRIFLTFEPNYSFWQNEEMGRMMLIIFEWPILIFSAINCSWFKKLLEINILKQLGKISMDIFLWHVPVQITIKTIDKIFDLNINYGNTHIWLLYIGIVLLTAIASYIISTKIRKKKYFIEAVVTIIMCAMILVVTDIYGIQMKSIVNNSLSYEDKSDILISVC